MHKAQRRNFVMGNAPGQRITLGIDPGTAIVGYAVVAARGDDLDMIACNVITTPAGMPLPQRLQHIYRWLGQVITIYHPNEAAMEELFFAKNAGTALTVRPALGLAMRALANGGRALTQHTPLY